MLRIFSRIRHTLIGSSSGRYVLYALGEIALVVIGILIALQVNNWNEWKKDRSVELEILNDLRLNLENNVTLIKGRVDYFEKGQFSARVIKNVLDKNLPYNDSLGVHFSKATRGYGGADVISYVGYESLRNNGFNLITNKSLRDEIMTLFENTYRSMISFDETFKLQNAYNQEIAGHLLYNDKQYSRKPFDYEALLLSKPYYASLTNHYENYKWMKDETLHGLAETKRVMLLISQELKRRN